MTSGVGDLISKPVPLSQNGCAYVVSNIESQFGRAEENACVQSNMFRGNSSLLDAEYLRVHVFDPVNVV